MIRVKILIFLFLIGLGYLLIPASSIPVLPNSYRSIEPGDNGGVKGIVAAYYTNLSREEVRAIYAQAYSHSSFLNLPLPMYLLNHPPEYALQTIIDTIHSNAFEELIQPLRSSLFISGWEPGTDKKYLRNDPRPVRMFNYAGVDYNKKIILYEIRSPLYGRIIVYCLIWLSGLGLVFAINHILSSPWRR